MATLEQLERRLGKISIRDPNAIDFNQLNEETARAVIFVGRSIRGLPRPESDVAMQMIDAGHLYTRLCSQIDDYDERRRFSKALEDIGHTPAGDWESTIQIAYAKATTTTPIRGRN